MEEPLLLKKSLPAVILCGGLGTRLRPVLADKPKALAPVNGRPFLDYLLQYLALSGVVNEVTLATGHLGEQIQSIYGSRYESLQLNYSREYEPLGTGGAIRQAASGLERVLVVNGDTLCLADLRALFSFDANRRPEAGAMVVFRSSDARRYGTVVVNQAGFIEGFAEKLAPREPAAALVNAGMYLLSQTLIRSITPGTFVSIERDIFPKWCNGGLLAWESNAPFLDIGTPESLAGAAEALTAGVEMSAKEYTR